MPVNSADANESMALKSELACRAEFVGHYRGGYKLYKLGSPMGHILFRLHDDSTIVLYQEHSRGQHFEPITWNVEGIESFYAMVESQKPIRFTIHSMRKYGQPKLKKPAELKGVTPSFSTEFTRRCRCQCFVLGDDLWIKHRDFFSPSWQPPHGEDPGKGQHYYLKKYFGVKRPQKFCYEDNFADIVLRSEAWLRIENIIRVMVRQEHGVSLEAIIRHMGAALKINSLDLSMDWKRFFEAIINEIRTEEKHDV